MHSREVASPQLVRNRLASVKFVLWWNTEVGPQGAPTNSMFGVVYFGALRIDRGFEALLVKPARVIALRNPCLRCSLPVLSWRLPFKGQELGSPVVDSEGARDHVVPVRRVAFALENWSLERSC